MGAKRNSKEKKRSTVQNLHASHRPLGALHRAVHNTHEPVGGLRSQNRGALVREGQDVVPPLAWRQDGCRHLAVPEPCLLCQPSGLCSDEWWCKRTVWVPRLLVVSCKARAPAGILQWYDLVARTRTHQNLADGSELRHFFWQAGCWLA